MPDVKRKITVKNPQGLHARPAAMFVRIVSKYNSTVSVSKDGIKVNGKSIMGILTLGAQKDSEIEIEANGEDAEEVIQELEQLLSKEEDTNE